MESLALKSIVAIRYGKKNPTKWLYEPHHKKTCMPNANNGTDHPAHLHSLIRAFVVHCLDSIISILAKSKISRLASFWSWAARFESCLVGNPTDRFSRDVAHIHVLYTCIKGIWWIRMSLITFETLSDSCNIHRIQMQTEYHSFTNSSVSFNA